MKTDSGRVSSAVPSDPKINGERESWLHLSRRGLEQAYSPDDVEYTLGMKKRPNPDYEKRRW